MMSLSHTALERTLLNLAVGQVSDPFGVTVWRVDNRRWSVAGGEPASLLVAIDQLVRVAGRKWL